MTAIAFRLPVIPLEKIHRIPVVLEEQRSPAPFGMAAFAFVPEPSVMLVVSLMAGITLNRRRVFVQATLMAGLAFGRDMSPS